MRISRLKVRAVSVSLSDDSGLRWVSLIPEAVINAHGTRWDFAAADTAPDELRFRFDDAVASLERWLTEFAPPIAIEHDKNGTAAGYLRRIRVLDAAEAALIGIVQKVPRMIYGGLDFTSPLWAARFDAGEIPYVSPNIRAYAGTELDEVPAYPFAIGEVSLVTIPQIKSNQVPVADMRGVSLSEGALMLNKADLATYCAENGMDEAAIAELIGKLFGAAHAEAHALNPELAEDPETIEAAAVAELERAAELEKLEEDKKAEALLAENGRLKADLRAAKVAAATAHVRAALGGRKVSPVTEASLAEAWMAGSGKFEALLRDIGGARVVSNPRTVAPVAATASQSVNLSDVMGPANFAKWDALSDDDQWKLISDLSEREKIAPHLAASWIRFGRTPDTVIEQRASKGRF